MTFPEAIKTCVAQKYADFNGRAGRPEYWWFYLFNLLLTLAASLVGQFAGESLGRILTGVIGLGLLAPSLAVCVRRLHDTNRSGWWLLIALIPVLGWIWLFVLMLIKGDEGANNYGMGDAGVKKAGL